MKIVCTVLGLILLVSIAYAEDMSALKSERDKVSYSIGMDIGKNLKNQSIDIDTDILSRGIKDSFSGGTLLLTEDEFQKTMTHFRKEMMDKQKNQMSALGEKNRTEGAAFLSQNKKKDGVVSLPSGLQYKIISQGKGDSPKATDKVSVHYRGTLMDGTEFDSSYSRGKPASFPVNGVIPGWTEALQLMKTGAKWQLFIPSDLAYGERGAGGTIGPNATLLFDVELLAIQ